MLWASVSAITPLVLMLAVRDAIARVTSVSVQAPEGALVIGREAGARRRRRWTQRLELVAGAVQRPGRRAGRIGVAAARELRPVADHHRRELRLRRREPGIWHRRLAQGEDVLQLGRVVR